MLEARNPWIDASRGVALLLMVLFHLQVDRVDFFAQAADYRHGLWWLIGKCSVVLFLFLAGLVANNSGVFSRRNLRVGGAALCVSLATWAVMPESYVRFGVLHLLTVAGCAAAFFSTLSTRQLVVLFLFVGAGGFLSLDSWLLGPGTPATTIDHYPLFPWLSVYLAGMAAARLGVRGWQSKRPLPFALQPLADLGRHTLALYLTHQPVMLLLLFVWYR